VTGVTFPALMENTVLSPVPAGIAFQLDCAPPHFSRHVRDCVDREFSDRLIG
jgi:hypothetical protein